MKHATHMIPTVVADIVFMSLEGWPTLADEIELQAEQQFASLEASLKGLPIAC